MCACVCRHARPLPSLPFLSLWVIPAGQFSAVFQPGWAAAHGSMVNTVLDVSVRGGWVRVTAKSVEFEESRSPSKRGWALCDQLSPEQNNKWTSRQGGLLPAPTLDRTLPRVSRLEAHPGGFGLASRLIM